ncbi:MAG TPA: SRPBCC family protein [Actinomycetota bacterium]|nr:SRPBCC family protein [Actinomycetota bacterium]
MSSDKPDISYGVERAMAASPDAIYAVLADPSRSLAWSGKDAPMIFRLRALQGAPGPQSVGDTWTSSGVIGYFKFQDRSTVVTAQPGRAFGFDTESTVPRKLRPTWYGRFENRYTIRPNGTGSIVTYTCAGYATNYIAFMWWPGFKVGTRAMFTMLIKRTLKKLERQAARTEARAA